MSLLELVTPSTLGYGPGEDIPGIDVGVSGWTGNKHKLPDPPFGKLGYRIDLQGSKLVTEEGLPLNVGPGTGFTEVLNGTIVMGGWKGVSAGLEQVAAIPGDVLRLHGIQIVGDTGRWAVHVRNFDLDLEEVAIDADLGEHHVYWGGPARWGLRARKCRFLNSNYECLKAVQRPWESTRWRRGKILVEGCTFENSSSGLVIQGAGCDVQVTHSIFKECRSPVRFDDGETTNATATWPRYYDHEGKPSGPGAANGHVLLEEVAIERNGTQLIGVNQIDSAMGEWPRAVLLSLEIRRCGLWGDGATIGAPRSLTLGHHRIQNNNLPAIQEFCQSIGMQALTPAQGS